MSTEIKSPLMRRAEVEAALGVKTSTLYAMIRSGAFPPGIKANPNAGRTGVVVWSRAVVESWIAHRTRGQVAAIGGDNEQ